MRFQRWSCLPAALLLAGTVAGRSGADASAAHEIPELQQALYSALQDTASTEAGQASGARLADAVAHWGYSFILPESNRLIERNMKRLEPYLVDAQSRMRQPDMRLLREFRVYASAEGRAHMCAILRGRVVFPLVLQKGHPQIPPAEQLGPRERPGQRLVPVVSFAEILADYRDQEASPVIQAVIDSLRGCTVVQQEWGIREPPSFYLQRALDRIAGKAIDPMVEPPPGSATAGDSSTVSSSWEISRNLVIEEVWLEGSMQDLVWKQIDLSAGRVRRLLGLLRQGTSFHWPVGERVLHSTAGLRLEMPGGVEALLTASSDGSVNYQDNSRITRIRSYHLMDPVLSDSLAAIARQFGRH